jgi:hypothetical protein
VFAWGEKQAKARQVSFNQVLIDALRDVMTLFGLPPLWTLRLEAERKKLKLSERDYIRQVLAERAEALGRQHDR